MRRTLIAVGLAILLGLVIVGVTKAQTWHTANQTTVGWDVVTEFANGDPLPATDVIRYKVWLKNATTGGEAAELAEVAELEHTVTLGIEGRYFVGVSAIRYSSEGLHLGESIICWSDEVECAEGGNTFGIQYFLPPAKPSGLKVK